MSALVLPEYYADLAQTTLNGAYTSGSGTMVVTSAAALSTTRQFHFMITDQTTGAVKAIGKATAVTSNTFTVSMTTDANANSGDFVTITLCAPGSTPYSFTARFQADSAGLIQAVNAGGGAAFDNNIGSFCLGWRDGAGKYCVLMTGLASDGHIYVTHWSSFSAAVSSVLSIGTFGAAAYYTQGGIWLKIQNDGTNLNFFVSIDGQNFYKVWHETITNYLAAATSVAIGVYGHSGSATFALYDWTQGT